MRDSPISDDQFQRREQAHREISRPGQIFKCAFETGRAYLPNRTIFISQFVPPCTKFMIGNGSFQIIMPKLNFHPCFSLADLMSTRVAKERHFFQYLNRRFVLLGCQRWKNPALLSVARHLKFTNR
jgi:hypothetical protein